MSATSPLTPVIPQTSGNMPQWLSPQTDVYTSQFGGIFTSVCGISGIKRVVTSTEGHIRTDLWNNWSWMACNIHWEIFSRVSKILECVFHTGAHLHKPAKNWNQGVHNIYWRHILSVLWDNQGQGCFDIHWGVIGICLWNNRIQKGWVFHHQALKQSEARGSCMTSWYSHGFVEWMGQLSHLLGKYSHLCLWSNRSKGLCHMYTWGGGMPFSWGHVLNILWIRMGCDIHCWLYSHQSVESRDSDWVWRLLETYPTGLRNN